MKQNIKIAKELMKLAKRLMAGDYFSLHQELRKAVENISKDIYNHLTLIGDPKVITFNNGYENIFAKFIFSYSCDDNDLSYIFDDLFQCLKYLTDEFLSNQFHKGQIHIKPEKNKIKDFIYDFYKKVVLKQDYTLDARYNLSFSETPDSLLVSQKTYDITFNNIKYSSIKELCTHFGYGGEAGPLYGKHRGVINEYTTEIKYENLKDIDLNKKFTMVSDNLIDIIEFVTGVDIKNKFDIYLKQNIDNIL